MPTLKQKKFIQELKNPENRLNVSECMRKSGYNETSVRSGVVRNSIRKYTQDIFTPDKTKRKILKFQKRCLKEGDLTNSARMIELEARISVPELRKQEIETNQPKEITINYGIQPDKVTQPIETKEVTENKAS